MGIVRMALSRRHNCPGPGCSPIGPFRESDPHVAAKGNSRPWQGFRMDECCRIIANVWNFHQQKKPKINNHDELTFIVANAEVGDDLSRLAFRTEPSAEGIERFVNSDFHALESVKVYRDFLKYTSQIEVVDDDFGGSACYPSSLPLKFIDL